MIAKHVSMNVTQKSDFGALVRYITSAQGRDERVGEIRVTNCAADEPHLAAYDAMLVQSANQRSNTDKTYHLIVSFRPGERPSAETIRAIEEQVCAGLGFGEHQRVSGVHHDTDNVHLHVAINKVHPTRFTVHTPLRDYRTIAELCDRLENEFGLEKDNHASRKRAGEGRAADMEQIGGLESLIGWVQRECAAEIRAADSWQALHATMAANGLTLHAKGNGLVVTAQDGTTIKASSIGRDLSKKALEARLGAFQAGEGAVAPPASQRSYERRPVASKVDTSELFVRYREQQDNRGRARAADLAVAAAKRTAGIEAVKRAGRLRRATIKLAGGTGATRRIAYGLTSRATKQAIDKIVAAHQRERERITQRTSRKGWHDWLQDQAKAGEVAALAALRGRHGDRHAPADAFHANDNGARGLGGAQAADHITKRGTIIYRSGAAAIRDDGTSLHVSRGTGADAITAALRIARDRYGESLKIAGSAEFKETVARAAASAGLSVRFDDPELERRRAALVTTQQEAARGREVVGRGDRGGDAGGGRQRAADRAAAGPGQDAAGAAARTAGARGAGVDGGARGTGRAGAVRPARPAGARRGAVGGKPNIGRVGREPPPEARDRVRDLSQLGVVRIDNRPSMLLPRDVHANMDNAEAGRDRILRWPVPRTGIAPDPARAAADKYIAERNAKRQTITDIPKHRPFEATGEPLTYAGTREIEGQKLALLRRGDEYLVLPMNATSAARAARYGIGEPIEITADGTVKSRGRRR